jgi:hypothetical protein
MEFYLVTNFTDPSWWRPWNFTGSQILLIFLQGQNQWKQWKKMVLAPGLLLGGESGTPQQDPSMNQGLVEENSGLLEEIRRIRRELRNLQDTMWFVGQRL